MFASNWVGEGNHEGLRIKLVYHIGKNIHREQLEV